MTICAQSNRGTVEENTSQSRWKCPHCGSEDIQIALPVWFREYADGELRQVDNGIDGEADPLYWACGDCGETGQHEPARTEAA